MPDSPHFAIQRLAEGVYAAIAAEAGAAVANAGILDLGDRTLVFDTCMTPQAARDLLRMAQELTGREPEIVFNSHYHNDHMWGNQVFDPRAQIFATRRTLELMQTEGAEEIHWASETAAKSLAENRMRLEGATDERERRDLGVWLAYFQALVDNMPGLDVRLPDVTFDDRLTITGSARTVEFREFKNAHTGSDTVMLLPQDGIVFAADLLFVDSHPYLAECDVRQTIQALDALSATGAKVFVPGHGPVGSAADLSLNVDYIETCLEAAQRLAGDGEVTPERARQEPIPEKFSSWTLRRFFAVNLQVLSKKYAGGAGSHEPGGKDR